MAKRAGFRRGLRSVGVVAQAVNGIGRIRTEVPGQLKLWFAALVVGIVAGFAALAFRKGIAWLQEIVYGSEDVHLLHTAAGQLPWYLLLVIPIIGGLIVGLILHIFTPDGRVRSVADVIEGAAIKDGRVEQRAGLASALASLITLGTGGSTGREGPVVHLAAVISTWPLRWMKADAQTGRDLLGCAVAAAVSASFNAPIAGALFALEVVLRHFAIHAFAPIVIASVAGTVLNRLEFGGAAEFVLSDPSALEFYEELPAFLLLGTICGIVAGLLMLAFFLAEDVAGTIQARLRIPRWLRPVGSGAILGLIAIQFPHIIGVGYETTARALSGDLLLKEAILMAVIKGVATAVTYGGRMGGGVFSPSLMVGALTGLAFGLIATSVFPEMSGTPRLYALAGLGGVAAAVLGAPISTTLIVFEMTGDWQTALAVMVTVSISTAIGSRIVDRSFFLTQLERRGIHVSAGPQEYLLELFQVRDIMRPMDHARPAPEDRCREMIEADDYLTLNGTLAGAFPAFDRTGEAFLPVVRVRDPEQPPELVGALFHVDALRIYNKALAAMAKEEHG
ncbi:chloride channel protein [Pseudooceanicola sp. HF7]|uniref:chloride channel protein n=1 Tax=Pseudooceanicola sp. HF7 TaxID=2721560 RepID=UPI0014320606|nr:chloride channel protein [Pseudooceanicola sp. HF7]NIZ11239.1 chloride channel protein [Pseudooceanicola sp. HF7]